MVRLRKWVLAREVPLIGILALCILGIWTATWRGTVAHLGRLRANDSLSLLQDRLQEEIRRVEAAGHAAESLTLENPLDEEHALGLETILPFLDHSGALTNLVLWRSDGHSATIMRTEKGWDLLLVASGKSNKLFTLRGTERVLVRVPPYLERSYLPRERPWYQFGARRSLAAWMPGPYPFWGSGVEGMSFVIPIRGHDGELLGMVCADIQLDILQRFMASLPARDGARFTGRFAEGPVAFDLPGAAAPDAHQATRPGSWRSRLAAVLRPDLVPIEAATTSTLAGQELMLRVQTSTGQLLPKAHLLFWISLVATEALFLGFAWSMVRLHEGLLNPLLFLLARRRRSQPEAPGEGQELSHEEPVSEVWEISEIVQRVRMADRIESEHDALMNRFERIQRMESVGELAAGHVHDANNLLTLALCQLSLCLDEVEGQQGLTAELRKVEGSIAACSDQLGRILAFSRKKPGVREEIDLNALCRAIGKLSGPALGKAIELRYELAADLPKVHGDSLQLEQALTNMLLNARDAMPEGGTIHLRTLRGAGGPCVEVRDEGLGVPPEIHRAIFEPFFTTKGQGKGTGLGLFMVSSIMKAHGGRVELVQPNPRGACFRLSFPPFGTVPA